MARRFPLSLTNEAASAKALDRSLVRSVSGHAIFAVSLEGYITSWNAGARDAFGYSEDEILGLHVSVFYTAADAAAALPEHELHTALTGSCRDQHRRLVRKNGSEFWGVKTIQPIFSEADEVIGFSNLVRDVTEIHGAVAAAHVNEQRLVLLLESVHDYAIFATDGDGRITSWNAGARNIFGYAEHEIVGGNLSLLAIPQDSAGRVIQAEFAEALKTGRSAYERWFVHHDGTRLLTSGKVRPMISPDDGTLRGFVTVAHDVTDRARAVNDLTRRALHDDLTGIPNRRLFYDNVHRAIALTKRHPQRLFAVLFIDLDRFKRINDDLGHIVGDSVLVSTARLLEACIRSEDLVARLGGDEFAVLLTGIAGLDDAREAAERIELAMRKPLAVDGRELTLSASIGIALSKTEYKTPEDVLQDADTAMYAAKSAGRARVAVFGEPRPAYRGADSNLVSELHDGIERGELVLTYQPIVNVRSSKITGFEALVRWQHPALGLLLPVAFLPQAQATDLILEIDRWVLRRACAQLKEWQSIDPGKAALQMSVNVSATEFSRPGFLIYLQNLVSDFALPPRCLQLEITKTGTIERSAASLQLLADIRGLGVEIHIDNFGSGYSALTLVGDLLVDALKIDISFVANVNTPKGERLVGMIAKLADCFGLTTVAQGVESADQLAAIRDIGCSSAQGFLISRPLSAQDARRFLLAADPPP